MTVHRGAGGSTSDLTMEICKTVQQYMGVDIMMHLTCTNMPSSSIYEALNEARPPRATHRTARAQMTRGRHVAA